MSMLSSRLKVLQSFVSRYVWSITIGITIIIMIIIIVFEMQGGIEARAAAVLHRIAEAVAVGEGKVAL